MGTRVALPPEKLPFPESSLRVVGIWKDLPDLESVSATGLLRSPDRRYIAYVLEEWRSDPSNANDFYRASLCRIRADGKDAQRLYSSGKTTDRNGILVNANPAVAAWSPDSRRILFWKLIPMTGSANLDGAPLYDMPLTGGAPRLLTSPYTTGGERDNRMSWRPDDSDPHNISFSPDGRHLLLIVGEGRFLVANKRIVCLDYPSGRLRWRTERHQAAIAPAWSPDGRQIVFTMTPAPGKDFDGDEIVRRWSRMHLWVMNADGTGKRRLKSDARYQEKAPRWERTVSNGQIVSILRFVRCDNADENWRQSLWEIRADGTGLRWLRNLPPEPEM